MARLTSNQVNRRIEVEQKKQEAIKKKLEIQQKIELYGENWREVEQQKLKSELDEVVGSEGAPKILSTIDVNSFLDPINFYKDSEGNVLKVDYNNYQTIRDQYQKQLEDMNADIAKLNESETKENQELAEKLSQERIKVKENSEEKISIMSNISKYFNRFIPLYDKHQCTCCGISKSLKEFYKTSSITCSDRVDSKGEFHLNICKDCANKLFNYNYLQKSPKVNEQHIKNESIGMKLTCADLNLYWDNAVFEAAREQYEENGRTKHILNEYINFINKNYYGMSFIDSPDLEKQEVVYQPNNSKSDETPLDWSKEDAKNKATIVKMVGSDPFKYESEEDRKILYRDLLNILEPGMENDFVKFQAAIQIVMSFFRIRKMNERYSELQKENASTNELKALSDLKDKELKSITQFSKDNGFAERYATAKAKGENTFTGILGKMNEDKFEKSVLNRYDIETSATIQQAADASFKAIFNQLGIGDGDLWKTTQDQFKEIKNIRAENLQLIEDLRKARYQIAQMNLEKKERERIKSLSEGFDVDESEDDE